MSIPESTKSTLQFFIDNIDNSDVYDVIIGILSNTPPANIGELYMILQENVDDAYVMPSGPTQGLDIYGGINIITLGDGNDELSVAAIEESLKTFLDVTNFTFLNPQNFNGANLATVYAEKIRTLQSREVTVSSLSDVIQDFYNSNAIIEDPDSRVVVAKYIKIRLLAVRKEYVESAYYIWDDIDWERTQSNEDVLLSEIVQEPISNEDTLDQIGLGNLQLLLNYSTYAKTMADSTDLNTFNDQVMINFITDISKNYDRVNLNSFYRVFSKTNQSIFEANPLDITSLINKMTTYGIFELASYAGEIAAFATKRLASTSTVQRSAAEFTDNAIDLPWLMKLNDVALILRKDQIFFASIVYYFPSLTTFILDAMAVVGDYSNGGRGGGAEDVVNDPAAMIDSLEKAFGIGTNGEQVFELALTLENTAQKIKKAIDASPFRRNVTPQNPDIFHFRLGAANFYVPPVGIDINSSFKAGSLMSGALRQKNSPKFNSGYKETSIRMRLFFPNYEEIWGISITDASDIKLTEDYKINFRGDIDGDGKLDGSSDYRIDKFLSSLRGLVAAFKYSPFLPVKNHYLNSVHGITAVGLSSMSIATIPNFPFALVVDLEMVNFNHKPFLPMLTDFNQAIHWGKYRQYMGKAAVQLDRYVNEEFLLKSADVKEADNTGNAIIQSISNQNDPQPSTDSGNASANDSTNEDTINYEPFSGNDILIQNVIKDWTNGNHLTLYAPAESQTKLFLPSMSSFRTEQEKLMTDLGRGTWESLLFDIGIDINESAGYGMSLADVVDISSANAYSKSVKNIILDSINILTSGSNAENNADSVYDYLVTNFIIQNKKYFDPNKNEDMVKQNWLKDKDDYTAPYPTELTYIFQGKFINDIDLNSVKNTFRDISNEPVKFLEYLVDKKIADQQYRTGLTQDELKVQEEVKNAFNVAVYERFFQSGPIQSLMEAARARSGAYQFNEWEVPMLRVDLDPESVIINGVTVSLGNILVKLQVQMQDEPTYQHIGGRDSYINISMTVIGEKELIKLKSIFDHVSGLARLEHASGVIGFLGIKNIITALSGIKYVMPLNYSVNTRPNFPHVYDVELSLVDFDIFQQRREQLNNKQQRDLIEHFNSKRNPFLRIKQLWGSFNAYPDFPLDVKNEEGYTVGCLDPDFYFRSFQMFDDDVIQHLGRQQRSIQDFKFDLSDNLGDRESKVAIMAEVQRVMRLYTEIPPVNNPTANDTRIDLLSSLVSFMESHNLTKDNISQIIWQSIRSGGLGISADDSNRFLLAFISFGEGADENNPFLFSEAQPSQYQIGSLSPNDMNMISSLEAALEGYYSIENDKDENGQVYVSFHPDEVDFHKQIFTIPASDPDDIRSNKLPSIMATALGTYYGYVDKNSGRFYLTAGNDNVTKAPSNSSLSAGGEVYVFSPNHVEDTQTPDRGTTNSMTGVYGTTALSDYQKAYSGNPASHWEKMLIDTRYRDVSGRMIRAFPTYMLWLIDEGGYFAGVKLFDNFYGLQSIIDFSVVSSEDLLGDTLIFRVSNLYSKLTKKESTQLFSTSQDDYVPDALSLPEGLGGIIDRTLNMSRNILSGMRNEYVVDIQNIRLKPGVRVHLRAGYGSNPNSLQTVFNGVITNVEQGEIVTVTAQSDAIELGAVVNSTNKKGDSGKIDGGIDTGMYLSEPRDLMVRLLSMGSSRTREALAHATRGTVFSENKFGIRHFGNILYQPLTEDERSKNEAVSKTVQAAYESIGGSNSSNTNGFSFGLRGNTLSVIGQLWANFAAQVDLEIFKRNIYPGNGLGIAQFLGGDLDDGWSTVASLTTDAEYFDRQDGYLGRLTDMTYNRILEDYQKNDKNAKQTVEELTARNRLIESGRAGVVKTGLSGAGIVIGAITASAMPVVGTAIAGAGLLGVLSGRGGENVFRAMGLISPNPDDDLSGFDEVSFRAQTYMRTVWDLFETCARLLPNYIVAVRPFEDRSTVFYGKPHWLYTAGVVPVTTGFPSQEKMTELGISGPKPAEPDAILQNILDTLNKDTNPLSDYAAYFQSFEPNENFMTVAQQIAQSTGIYAPSKFFAGRTLNFFSEAARTYRKIVLDQDSRGGGTYETLAKLPVSKGYVGIGPHLPIIEKATLADGSASGQTSTEGILEIQNRDGFHRQINNLPPRYRFPYFTVNEKLKLENSSRVAITPSYYEFSDWGDWKSFTYNSLDLLGKLEVDFFEETKFTVIPSIADETSGGIVNLDTPIDFNNLIRDAKSTIELDTVFIRMPIPNIFSVSGDIPLSAIETGGEYSFEYSLENYGELTYKDWGAPETPEDEQFYIAMRWPYNIASDIDGATAIDNQTLAVFKEKYGFTELVGSVQDYKDRKVLVYNPNNGRAVVCKPAYFLWGEGEIGESSETGMTAPLGSGDEYPSIDARVSPDAAYFLSIITLSESEAKRVIETSEAPDMTYQTYITDDDTRDKLFTAASSGYRFAPQPQECYFAFVPDSFPVGVLSISETPISNFTKVDTAGNVINKEPQYDEDGNLIHNEEEFIVGFGKFISKSEDNNLYVQTAGNAGFINALGSDAFYEYKLYNTEYTKTAELLQYGGNPVNLDGDLGYFNAVINANYDLLAKDKLNELKDSDRNATSATRTHFIEVWDPSDMISIQARQYFDERYDPGVSVIAGNGRTLGEAQLLWDLFRAEYHNSDSVKRIFFDVYGLNPDSEDLFPEMFLNILNGGSSVDDAIKLFRESGEPNALDEFAILLGSDFTNDSVANPGADNSRYQNRVDAIEFMRANWIDQSLDDGGLVEYYNHSLKSGFAKIGQAFFDDKSVQFLKFFLEIDSEEENIDIKKTLLDKIKTPKQLYLLIVGIFRQRMWEDPYARAWLVLKPDKKPGWTGSTGWSFKPVDPIFKAFIDPSQDYAKPSKKAKFLQLLVANRGEGNNSSNYFQEAAGDIGSFVNKTVGPIFSAIGDALSGLLSMFKLSMQQLGYALSEVGNFKRQANILNKALNDSIYYSLGRPGTILRAVDNPFTREYGEPVLEIREPFQRLHYISSFSHILSNQIQENLNGVATAITAVSDGKYPVSVALDKGAPAERQVEKTVETGIIFDNFTGSGFTGFLHPFFHPLETFRGVAKNIQGTPDELSARRVALAHLKESIKDIYGGELIVIGNTDIRPHDLVYLSDVYERMYGIFEVEQVVHHFTPELGFITSITPNALVTVNDPARWFMTSWMQSWMHVQNIRNDSRIYMDNIRNANSGLSLGGNISVDRLSEILSTQLIGGFQFTHGSSALLKDIIASETAKMTPGVNQSMLLAEANKGDGVGGVPTFAMMAAAVPFIGPLAWKGWKWVRDNVLDQHGCYVQYLNKNGQPMDAGLSYNQGMVVGQHHSTSLLPGILGVRAKTRTAEGNSYIRTDDLFKSMGWNETAISEVTRYISYETSLVHARVLQLSGLGPEKAAFDWQFKVLCKVTNILDGDTIDVQDIISGAEFRIRFDAINTSETNVMGGTMDYPNTSNPTQLSILDISTPGGQAKMYVKNAIENKIIVARINKTRTDSTTSNDTRMLEEQFEAGSSWNNIQNYQLDIFGRSADGTIDQGDSSPRAIGTLFYRSSPDAESNSLTYVSNLFRQNISDLSNIKDKFRSEYDDKSPFYTKFNEIYTAVSTIIEDEYYSTVDPFGSLNSLTSDQKVLFSRLVYIKILEDIYDIASRWPAIEWDEYYPDGTPVTLNWELVVNNLARVFVKDLQKESQSVLRSETGLTYLGD